MANKNPKTEHLKQYELKPKRPEYNDRATMIDMIKAGTDVEAFMIFWSKEAGYKLSSLKTMYYDLRSRI